MPVVSAIVLCLAGCGRVNFGYPIVPCDEVTGSESALGLWSSAQAFSDDVCSQTRIALCERDE